MSTSRFPGGFRDPRPVRHSTGWTSRVSGEARPHPRQSNRPNALQPAGRTPTSPPGQGGVKKDSTAVLATVVRGADATQPRGHAGDVVGRDYRAGIRDAPYHRVAPCLGRRQSGECHRRARVRQPVWPGTMDAQVTDVIMRSGRLDIVGIGRDVTSPWHSPGAFRCEPFESALRVTGEARSE